MPGHRALGAVSPHLDDLALSCAGLLAAHPGSSMVTVFAGGPASVDPVTGWEALSGMFEPGADIVGARRAEDVRAASLLGCAPVHLDHWDEQYRNARYGYGGPVGRELEGTVSAALETLIARSGLATWLVPLGLRHPDHEITAGACLAVAERHPEIDWLVYEELPYAAYDPGLVNELVAGLRDRGLELGPAEDLERSGPSPIKRRVIDCYASQVASLGDGALQALRNPERARRLSRPSGLSAPRSG